MEKNLDKKTRALTNRQKRFVSEYLIDLNATQAAIRAGYSEKTAGAIGHENLKKPEIQAAMQGSIAEMAKRTEITADYVLSSLRTVAERCMQAEPVTTMVDGVKSPTGEWKFDSAGANRSLELLGKHLRLFADKTELSGPNGGPVEISRIELVPLGGPGRENSAD